MPISINGTTGISGVDGSAGTPALQGSDANTGIAFGSDVIIGSTNGTEAFRVDSSGRLGLGASAPDERLVVAGAIRATSNAANWASSDGAVVDYYAGDMRIVAARAGSNSSTIQFHTYNSGTAAERMRITNDGRLLVGTTTSYGRIHSPGYGYDPTTTTWLSGAAIATSGSYGGGFSMLDGPAGYSLHLEGSGANFYIQRHTSTTSTASGGVYINNGATSWSGASDERDKVDLQPITNGLEKIKSLRAVIGAYSWEPEIRHPFLIAQDVQAVLPEAVSVQNLSAPVEDQRLGMSYTDVVPLLVQALKEAGERIEQLEAKVAALESA